MIAPPISARSVSQNGVRGSVHMIENGMANIRPPDDEPPDQTLLAPNAKVKVLVLGLMWMVFWPSPSAPCGAGSFGFATKMTQSLGFDWSQRYGRTAWPDPPNEALVMEMMGKSFRVYMSRLSLKQRTGSCVAPARNMPTTWSMMLAPTW